MCDAGRLQALEQAVAMSGLPDSCHLSLPSEPPQSLIGRVELLETSLAQIVQIQVRNIYHIIRCGTNCFVCLYMRRCAGGQVERCSETNAYRCFVNRSCSFRKGWRLLLHNVRRCS